MSAERARDSLPLFDRFRREFEDLRCPALAKLAYEKDNGREGREHLWFEVHAYEGGNVDATLLNQPYRIAALSEGARARHSLDRLSDWSILCERGRFDANTIAELERSLLDAPGAH